MSKRRNFLVTGGAGFIGSAVCHHLIGESLGRVINVDCLTYAGNTASLSEIADHPDYTFVQANILDQAAIAGLLREHDIDIVLHLAAESHVDRSIDGPGAFVETNVTGTFRMLDAALGYYRELAGEKRDSFRFHHISTDEVFGDLPFDSGIFTETTPYNPSSPYSASKAASDHFVRAWQHTFGLPVIISNTSNNYGPRQFPEKLIPLVLLNAVHGRELPIYGKGENVRDWLHVEDHARALALIATKGVVGENYNVGGSEERTNLQVVQTICDMLDEIAPRADGASYRQQITFVTDRPGHDRRYAIDSTKIGRELGWQPRFDFESGLKDTIRWYLAHEDWWQPLLKNKYDGQRLGQIETNDGKPVQ